MTTVPSEKNNNGVGSGGDKKAVEGSLYLPSPLSRPSRSVVLSLEQMPHTWLTQGRSKNLFVTLPSISSRVTMLSLLSWNPL
jgi:hypothetical protein